MSLFSNGILKPSNDDNFKFCAHYRCRLTRVSSSFQHVYNLFCSIRIKRLPDHWRKGYGSFLIILQYKLTRSLFEPYQVFFKMELKGVFAMI